MQGEGVPRTNNQPQTKQTPTSKRAVAHMGNAIYCKLECNKQGKASRLGLCSANGHSEANVAFATFVNKVARFCKYCSVKGMSRADYST